MDKEKLLKAVKEYLEIVKTHKALSNIEPITIDDRIKETEEQLERAFFIRRLLGQEKNWIIKVLKN